MDDNLINFEKDNFKETKIIVAGFLFLFFSFILIIFLSVKAPKDFPRDSYFEIKNGQSVLSIATELKEKKYIKSIFVFRVLDKIFTPQNGLLSGNYYFEDKENALRVLVRFFDGDYNIDFVRVTIREGVTPNEVASILASNLIEFDAELFKSLISKEGVYLFPDTYFFLPSEKPERVVSEMVRVFDLKTKDLKDEVISKNKNWKNILIMASIIEKEARKNEERALISGILWKRISIGMPLQVDASFLYLLGKSSGELTLADLRIDSPYNTYLYKGLPPSPISLPSLESIKASINPESSSYLYYLHGDDGVIRYGKTYNEHLNNKNRYIR